MGAMCGLPVGSLLKSFEGFDPEGPSFPGMRSPDSLTKGVEMSFGRAPSRLFAEGAAEQCSGKEVKLDGRVMVGGRGTGAGGSLDETDGEERKTVKARLWDPVE